MACATTTVASISGLITILINICIRVGRYVPIKVIVRVTIKDTHLFTPIH